MAYVSIKKITDNLQLNRGPQFTMQVGPNQTVELAGTSKITDSFNVHGSHSALPSRPAGFGLANAHLIIDDGWAFSALTGGTITLRQWGDVRIGGIGTPSSYSYDASKHWLTLWYPNGMAEFGFKLDYEAQSPIRVFRDSQMPQGGIRVSTEIYSSGEGYMAGIQQHQPTGVV